MKVLWLGVLSTSAVLVKPIDCAACAKSSDMYSSSHGSVLLKAAYAIGLPKRRSKGADTGFISCSIHIFNMALR